jgi:isopenicillin N synthase-like dioxygenase
MAPFKGYPYGYFISESESLAKSKGFDTPPDLKESFNGGPIKQPKGKISKEALDFCYLPTIWPDVDNFEKSWKIYYNEMEKLSQRIMSVFAIALKLPSNYFAKFIDNPISALRALNYPLIKKEVLPNQQRAGAHTDYGSLTILLPLDSVQGLQIKNSNNRWVNVPNIKNSFIINIGDLMVLWTNDRWTSTLHRVIPIKRNNDRKTLAFFHQPNWDAKIKCLNSCLGEGSKYPEVFSGPYLMKKFKSTT